MSSSRKLTLLALVAAAAAVPHQGHSKFHKPSGGYGNPAYPTGGWTGPSNTTQVVPPAGTGSSAYPDEQTSTVDEYLTSTTTLTSTIYVQATPSSKPAYGGEKSVVVEDVSSAPAAQCGPETIYVTATDKVTVTVTAGNVIPSSEAPVIAPTGGYEAPPAQESSAPVVESSYVAPPAPETSTVEEKVTISLPQKEVDTPTPAPTSEQIYSILPVASETPAPPAPTSDVVVEPSKPVESSAAPEPSKPASNPGYNGGKRGLAYNDASLCSAFAGKASWAYSWGSAPGGDLPEGMSFVPLAWIKNESPAQWLQKVDEAVSAGTKVVMGFNEPDHPAPQADMLPSVACPKWSEYMNPIAAAHPDVTILGPSVTNAGDKPNWGLDWYKNFMAECPGAIWHAANIHFYDIYQEGEGTMSTVNRFKKHVEDAVKLTGKKVWVTEFGLNPGSASPAQTEKFLREVMAFMDGSDDVQGYAYFMVGQGEGKLNEGTGLSSIGQVYASG